MTKGRSAVPPWFGLPLRKLLGRPHSPGPGPPRCGPVPTPVNGGASGSCYFRRPLERRAQGRSRLPDWWSGRDRSRLWDSTVWRCVSQVHSASAPPLAPTAPNSLGPARGVLVLFIDRYHLGRQNCTMLRKLSTDRGKFQPSLAGPVVAGSALGGALPLPIGQLRNLLVRNSLARVRLAPELPRHGDRGSGENDEAHDDRYSDLHGHLLLHST